MCELENISNGEIFKVTVNNGASENLSDKNNHINISTKVQLMPEQR